MTDKERSMTYFIMNQPTSSQSLYNINIKSNFLLTLLSWVGTPDSLVISIVNCYNGNYYRGTITDSLNHRY